MTNITKTATLGGGCFWCLDAVFEDLKGVVSVDSGYAGGHVKDPSYEAVCNGSTGHAEVVQIVYEPEIISYADLLRIFFTIHDPTTLNRQGADIGTQYRSIVLYHDDEQKAEAEAVMAEISQAEIWPDPIVTEIAAYDGFYLAEAYHQSYFANNPNQPYCRAVIAPKVAKFRKKYEERLKG